MIYHSTRSRSLTADAATAIQAGLAPDGGLYIPQAIPDFSGRLAEMRRWDPLAVTKAVLNAWFPGLPAGTVDAAVEEGYTGRFSSDPITPAVPVGDAHVLELFHGPTCAFKDMALLILPHLISSTRQDKDVMILTATSGDTGKAAAAGFANVPHTKICVFYPRGGVSPLQLQQMATQEGDNVRMCAIEGNFDDAQRGVKTLLSDPAFAPESMSLSSANSINIGRLAPQVAYYFTCYFQLAEKGAVAFGAPVDFVVPTGNFGNILAGYLAKRMGLPVGRLVCASNPNDVLHDFLRTGVYDRRSEFFRTSSPSMDILVSSNLERLLYLASGGDDAFVSSAMDQLAAEGHYTAPAHVMQVIGTHFLSGRCDDAAAAATIRQVWQEQRYLLDPHTAVAWNVYEQTRPLLKNPAVILSTASPYKFPESMLTALELPVPEDPFAALDALHAATGVAAPAPLTALNTKPVRHRDCILPEQMAAYVEAFCRSDEPYNE